MTVTKCRAKINYFLEITGKRPDGYHTIDTLMQSVGLCDLLYLDIVRGDGKISVLTDDPLIPDGESNLAYKAAKAYFNASGDFTHDVKIVIEKHIPSGAGLGGGSTDAAGVLSALNRQFSAFSPDSLDSLALSLGADIPFCLHGGCLRARGIGDVLSDGGKFPFTGYPILIAKGSSSVSTKKAYSDADLLFGSYSPLSPEKLIVFSENREKEPERLFFNRFEDVIIPLLPEVGLLKERMMSGGAVVSLMSGSGSAVFGVFPDTSDALKMRDVLRSDGFFAEIITDEG